MSTGMQYGVALPHGRTDAVRSIACAVGVKREGVDFDELCWRILETSFEANSEADTVEVAAHGA